ncbi:MAG: SDR family oxidoreductase, partial [Phycisphaerales bacterium]|nr:SDR family oxidoreductase [Phycisphaerales bacterium]
MRVLFIGGTGNISTACSKLALARGIDLHLLNRGQRPSEVAGAKTLTANIADPASAAKVLADQTWDVVVNWIAYTPQDVQRDIELFRGKTGQYIFISSAACYQKPPVQPIVTESTPLYNPHWKYAQDKIASEELLMKTYREADFPITIVRPSHTYQTIIPAALGGCYSIIDRMKRGLPIVVHGDGTSLWTLTHSEDFAKGLVGLLGRSQAIGHAFHITSDESLTWNQIHTAMAYAVGEKPNIVHVPTDFIMQVDLTKRGPLIGDKSHSTIFDNTKIKKLVPDFVCSIPFEQGIKRTIAWFEADPSRQKIAPANAALQERLLTAYHTPRTPAPP